MSRRLKFVVIDLELSGLNRTRIVLARRCEPFARLQWVVSDVPSILVTGEPKEIADALARDSLERSADKRRFGATVFLVAATFARHTMGRS
jgi:hypothetical protein